MKRYAVVTGASSGLGAQFCRQLSAEGFHMIMVARRRDRLIDLQKELPGESDIFIADLSKTNDIDALCTYIREKISCLSVFINNAGFGLSGEFCSTDEEREMEMVDVNIKAVHRLTKRIIWIMNEQHHAGYILNVASSAGLYPAGPYMATYYATKAYVASMTRAAAYELAASGSRIYLGALCPGPVNTEFNDVAGVAFALSGISAKRCVSEAIRGMKKRRIIIIPTLYMKLAVYLSRPVPRKILIPLIARQQHSKMRE
jgi:short-subunit dehydrogenase